MADMLGELQDRLGYRFRDSSLLQRAMTHSSARGDDQPANERLEFLGDALVGLVISEHLFRSFPALPEGRMTRIKSSVVSRRTLARVGRSLRLPEWLRVDAGLEQRESYPTSMVAGVYEAVVGAIFLDGGMEATRDFILRTLAAEVERVLLGRHHEDYKSLLQRRTLAEAKGIPDYRVVRQEGPDHHRQFLTVVYIDGERCGSGWGATKKSAEQNAAAQALRERYPESNHAPGEGSGREGSS